MNFVDGFKDRSICIHLVVALVPCSFRPVVLIFMCLFLADLLHEVFHDGLLVLDVLHLDSVHFWLEAVFVLRG
jgi:hypothetical protein